MNEHCICGRGPASHCDLCLEEVRADAKVLRAMLEAWRGKLKLGYELNEAGVLVRAAIISGDLVGMADELALPTDILLARTEKYR